MMTSKKLVRLKMLHVVQGVKLHGCIRKLSQNSIIEIDWYGSKLLLWGKWLTAEMVMGPNLADCSYENTVPDCCNFGS